MKYICLFVVLISLNKEALSYNVIDGVFNNIGTFSKYKNIRDINCIKLI